ncbi:TPA: hypothetical protein G8R56_003031 [Salmonella enterica]|uniref:Uncharacterized protein n=1 Tax=Salmonella enterica TaxID=28901 RepID=A0A759M899_SALER|nr:hypothetical protein [Salmonella enterica]
MSCYIRNVLLVDSALTEGNIDISSLEIAVNNYPKHEQAIVRVEVDSGCGEDIIGIVQRIYIANNCLYGDIKFTKDWKFVVSNLIYKPFPLATISGVINVPDLTYLDKVDFISCESNACSVAIDLNSIVGEKEYAYWLLNRPRYAHAQEATQRESAILFKKKYDNNDSGIIYYVKNEGSETPTMQDSPFIHAPGLSRKELIDWLNDVYVALYTEKSDYASQVADIEKKKQDINNELNKRMETLKKAFPRLDPESILSQDRKAT